MILAWLEISRCWSRRRVPNNNAHAEAWWRRVEHAPVFPEGEFARIGESRDGENPIESG